MKLFSSKSTKNFNKTTIQLLVKNKCFHKQIIQISETKAFCGQCGVFGYKDQNEKKFQFLGKPFTYSREFNASPFDIVNAMKHHHKLQKEQKKSVIKAEIMPLQYLTQRLNVILYIKRLKQKFKTTISTFIQAIEFLDIYINSLKSCPKNEDTYYEIATTCFVLAFKYFEACNPYEFEVIDYTNYPFDTNQLLKNEKRILKSLDHEVFRMTIYEICTNFKYCGFLFPNEVNSSQMTKSIYASMDNSIENDLVYNEDLFSTDYFLVSFALVLYTRKKFKLKNDTTNINYLKQLYQINDAEYEEVQNYIKKFFPAELEENSSVGSEQPTPEIKKVSITNQKTTKINIDDSRNFFSNGNNIEDSKNLASNFKTNVMDITPKNPVNMQANIKKIMQKKVNLKKIQVKPVVQRRNESTKNETLSLRGLKLFNRQFSKKESESLDQNRISMECFSKERQSSMDVTTTKKAYKINCLKLNQVNNALKLNKVFNVSKINFDRKQMNKSRSTSFMNLNLGSDNSMKMRINNIIDPQTVKAKLAFHKKKLLFPKIKY